MIVTNLGRVIIYMVSNLLHNMNDYIGSGLAGEIPKLVNISLDSVIAELVDNCLDAKAKKIHIEISGTSWDNFSVVVYDNSKEGFSSEQELDTAFRLSGSKARVAGEIGSFHMGMKVSTLSKFSDVAAFTKIGTNILHRRLNQHHIEDKIYEPLEDIIYAGATEVKDKILAKGWTTGVCLSNPKSKLFGKEGKIKKSTIDGFSKQLAMFFGITYESILLDDKNLELTINDEEAIPLDPFWNSFTTSNIADKLAIPLGSPGHVADPIQRNILRCTLPWATISTIPIKLNVPFDGANYEIRVQGYIIPYREARKHLVKNDLVENIFVEKPTNAGTATLNAQFLQGFFFYREGRCIAFGDTGLNSNDGWYDYGSSSNNLMTGVRFKIEFPKNLDEFMNLSPTKSTVDPGSDFYSLIQTAWDQKITDPLLRANLGDGKRSFYSKEGTGKTVVGAATTSNLQSKMWSEDCTYCDGFHPKGVDCHAAPCKICKSTGVCNPSCIYKCKHCSNIGLHVELDCPLNCDDCGLEGGHKDKLCPKICPDCTNLSCTCDCKKCKLSHSKCTCEKDCETCGLSESKCECGQSDSEVQTYPADKLIELTLFRKNDADNIIKIREALDFLHLKKEDL